MLCQLKTLEYSFKTQNDYLDYTLQMWLIGIGLNNTGVLRYHFLCRWWLGDTMMSIVVWRIQTVQFSTKRWRSSTTALRSQLLKTAPTSSVSATSSPPLPTRLCTSTFKLVTTLHCSLMKTEWLHSLRYVFPKWWGVPSLHIQRGKKDWLGREPTEFFLCFSFLIQEKGWKCHNE